MKGFIDRFEGEFVVIEIDGVTKDIAKSEVDDNAKAGDSVVFEAGRWVTDQEATKIRSSEIKKLMDNVWED